MVPPKQTMKVNSTQSVSLLSFILLSSHPYSCFAISEQIVSLKSEFCFRSALCNLQIEVSLLIWPRTCVIWGRNHYFFFPFREIIWLGLVIESAWNFGRTSFLFGFMNLSYRDLLNRLLLNCFYFHGNFNTFVLMDLPSLFLVPSHTLCRKHKFMKYDIRKGNKGFLSFSFL